MTVLQRFGYYLGGFSIGLVILAFFLNGKNASCDYTPNARTIKNISSKKEAFSEMAISQLTELNMDSTEIKKLIDDGSVDFSSSHIDSENDCNLYIIESSRQLKNYILNVENCDSIATLKSITLMSKGQ